MSHHYSGPDFGFPHRDARLDLTDLYAFGKTGDASKSILIMNVHPSEGVNPPGPTTAEPFAPGAVYELKIDTDGDAVADIAYRVLFSRSERGAQTATLRRVEGEQAAGTGDNGETIIEGAPVSTGREARVTEAGDYRFFAGWRSDPFFFDTQGALNKLQFTGDDFFAEKDVCSIVLEVPNSALAPRRIGLWHMKVLVSVILASSQLLAQDHGKEHSMRYPALYRTAQIDGLSIFYREAGPKDGPTLLLLHGLPSSSRMFEPLLSRLSDRYHLIAPDYPGFGHSDWPDPKKFAYTFDRYAEIMNHFTEALGLSRYTLYMQDYGGPVGFRMALAHPERVEALIVQDAVAHNEGLGANWKTRRAFWADRAANESALRTNLLSLATTRTRHLGNDPNVERYDPDLWSDEFAFLNQPGQADIQSDLFYDYRTNVEAYPKWQAWMREKQPRLLVIWGKYESSFDPSEPEAYRRDVPNAQVHIVDGGHFALDMAADEIAALVRGFVASSQ